MQQRLQLLRKSRKLSRDLCFFCTHSMIPFPYIYALDICSHYYPSLLILELPKILSLVLQKAGHAKMWCACALQVQTGLPPLPHRLVGQSSCLILSVLHLSDRKFGFEQ